MTRYEDAVRWLYSLEAAKGMDFKLERIELALKWMGNPHRRYPSVHVAGTNGKGSVAAMVHAMATAAGCRVGLYTSPHLVSFTERIRVGHQLIETERVAEMVGEMRSQVISRGVELTFFEIATVMAFVHFAEAGVDLAVVEVGLGGRLDATNVIDPAVAVITTIGLDHEEYLGTTIESIAAEKGGIIKPGRPTVIGRVPASARAVLRAVAAERGSETHEIGREFAMSGGQAHSYAGIGRSLDGLTVGLRGAHQRDNAATALAAVELLGARVRIDDTAVRKGLANVRWPGRLEVVSHAPLVVLDGAHNPDGVEAMLREVRPLFAGRRVTVVFGVMRDKRWRPMAEALAGVADEIVATGVLPPRGEAPDRVAAVCSEWVYTRVVTDPIEAVAGAVERAGDTGAVLVTGSLFLIGAVYAHLRPAPSLAMPGSAG